LPFYTLTTNAEDIYGMKRNQFITLLFLGFIAACKKAIAPEKEEDNLFTFITADLNTELLTIGSIKQNTVQGAFVQRIAAGNVPASFLHLSLRCTHSGCTVRYQDALGEFHCPCHGSKFTGVGNVINGPANRPLEQYKLAIVNNVLTIKG
jgi:Rieske Fe-S protein